MTERESPIDLSERIEAKPSLFSGRPRERAADEPYLRLNEVPLFIPGDPFTPETKRLAIGGINWVLDEHLRYGSLPETAEEHPSEHAMFMPRTEREAKERAIHDAIDKDFDVSDLKRLSELIATIETEIGHIKNDQRRGELHYLLEAAQALYDYGKSAYRRNNCNQLFGIYNNYHEAFAELLPEESQLGDGDELYRPAALVATGLRMLDHLHRRQQDDGRDTLGTVASAQQKAAIERIVTNRRKDLEHWITDIRAVLASAGTTEADVVLRWVDDPTVLLMNEPSSPLPSNEVLQKNSELLLDLETALQKVMEVLRGKLRARGVHNIPSRKFPEYATNGDDEQHETLTPPELIEALRQMLIRLKAQLREVPPLPSPTNEPAVF